MWICERSDRQASRRPQDHAGLAAFATHRRCGCPPVLAGNNGQVVRVDGDARMAKRHGATVDRRDVAVGIPVDAMGRVSVLRRGWHMMAVGRRPDPVLMRRRGRRVGQAARRRLEPASAVPPRPSSPCTQAVSPGACPCSRWPSGSRGRGRSAGLRRHCHRKDRPVLTRPGVADSRHLRGPPP